MSDGNLIEGEEQKDETEVGRGIVVRRIVAVLLLMPFALLVPPLLLPIVVESGMGRDILVAGCQLALGIGVILGVCRSQSRKNVVTGMILPVSLVAFYWLHLRGDGDTYVLVIVVLAAVAWISAGRKGLYGPQSRNLSQAEDVMEHAKGAYRMFVLLVFAAAMKGLTLLWCEPPAHEYILLLVILAGSLVAYMHFRLTLLERAMAESPSKTSGQEQQSDQALALEGGPAQATPDGNWPTS